MRRLKMVGDLHTIMVIDGHFGDAVIVRQSGGFNIDNGVHGPFTNQTSSKSPMPRPNLSLELFRTLQLVGP